MTEQDYTYKTFPYREVKPVVGDSKTFEECGMPSINLGYTGYWICYSSTDRDWIVAAIRLLITQLSRNNATFIHERYPQSVTDHYRNANDGFGFFYDCSDDCTQLSSWTQLVQRLTEVIAKHYANVKCGIDYQTLAHEYSFLYEMPEDVMTKAQVDDCISLAEKLMQDEVIPRVKDIWYNQMHKYQLVDGYDPVEKYVGRPSIHPGDTKTGMYSTAPVYGVNAE